MKSASRSVQWIVWTILGTVIALLVVLYVREQSSQSKLPVFGSVRPFTLTNQLGERVTLESLQGKVWVGDIIFARCAGPCPRMTDEMSKLQAAFGNNDDFRLVTLTTDPEHDTPGILAKYGERFGANSRSWLFLTGEKPEIKKLAVDGLKLAAVEKDQEQQQNENDLFIHSTTFVLVDRSGSLRGVYESLEPGAQERISADIKSLLAERK